MVTKKSGFSEKVLPGFRFYKYLLFLLGILILIGCSPNNSEIEKTLLEKLREIDGFFVTQITPPDLEENHYTECFQIDVIQPVDHNDPDGVTFRQRIFLSHRDPNKPVVFYSSGYGISRNYETELSAMLRGNQILMVHRFFPNATPDPVDWQHCNIRQAAADQHQIKELLKNLYPGKWVSGGTSKGGMTALFYKRFYPGDVDATIAYVAPIMTRPDDPRFIGFLNNQVGTSECRDKVKKFQRLVLSRRDQLMPLLEQHANSNSYSFTVFSLDEAFEYSVLEYIFQFWQYGSESNCNIIPDDNFSDTEIFAHLINNSPISYYSDRYFDYYKPLFYQAYTELGYCPYVYMHIEDLLVHVSKPSYRVFAPRNEPMAFNPDVMQDAVNWLTYQGENIIYIYGSIDPWTAAALNPASSLDAFKVIQAGGNHGVRIHQLDQRDQVIITLNRWLGTNLSREYFYQKKQKFYEFDKRKIYSGNN